MPSLFLSTDRLTAGKLCKPEMLWSTDRKQGALLAIGVDYCHLETLHGRVVWIALVGQAGAAVENKPVPVCGICLAALNPSSFNYQG